MTKLYNNMVEQISSKLSLTSKVNVVGSASIKRSVYYSDYDLFEKVQGMSEKSIHNHFKTVFEIIKKSDNVTITDFKCGEVGGIPLRWTYEEIKNNNNKGITFSEALKHKSIIKMDIVALINARFVEITEVYSIFLNGRSNMSPTLEEILDSISDEYSDEVRNGNYMKALKRMFSILKLKNEEKKKQEILLDYFNSPNGLIYRSKNDLETMYLVLDSPKFNIVEIRNSLQVLKETISAFPVDNSLEQISKLKTKQAMKPLLRKQIRLLKTYINEQAKQFINQNGI
jgi:hypothetical protein